MLTVCSPATLPGGLRKGTVRGDYDDLHNLWEANEDQAGSGDLGSGTAALAFLHSMRLPDYGRYARHESRATGRHYGSTHDRVEGCQLFRRRPRGFLGHVRVVGPLRGPRQLKQILGPLPPLTVF